MWWVKLQPLQSEIYSSSRSPRSWTASEATLCGEQMRKPGTEFMVRDDDVDIVGKGLDLTYPNEMWEIKFAKFKTLPT